MRTCKSVLTRFACNQLDAAARLEAVRPNRPFAARSIGGFRICYTELVRCGSQDAAIALPALFACRFEGIASPPHARDALSWSDDTMR